MLWRHTTLIQLMLLAQCCVKNHASNITISTIPEDGRVVEGRNLSIRCWTDGGSAFPVTLLVNSQDATEYPKVKGPFEPAHNRTYIYQSVEKADNGLNFSCRIAKDGIDMSENVTLQVLFLPTIPTEIMDVSGIEKTSATIKFSVEATPQVIANGINILPARHPSPNVSVNGSEVTVVYQNLQRLDIATYTIEVTNSIGSTNISFQLDVFFGPDFSNSSTHITVPEGLTLRIDCSITDTNPPVKSITINGTEFSEILNISNAEFVRNTVTPNYSGSYICTAINGQTSNTKVFNVTINEEATSMPLSSSQSISATTTPEPTSDDGLSIEIIAIVVSSVVLLLLLLLLVVVAVIGFVLYKRKPKKGGCGMSDRSLILLPILILSDAA